MWGVFDATESVHVVPVGADEDHAIINDHTLVEGCWCRPTIEDTGRPLVIHNAFDN